VSPAAGGTVTKSPDQSSYTEGSTVTLTATAAAGYVFSSWSGDATGTTNPLTVTMNSNKTIIANFTQLPTYTLTVTNVPADGGTVTKSPDATSYPQGSTVTLTATPAYGYVFSSWSGDVTGTTNPVTVTMDGNKAVTANYTALTRYMLLTGKYVTAVTSPDDATTDTSSLTKDGLPVAFGTITKTPNYDTYASGTVVTLTATPVAGFTKFVGWYSSATQMNKYTLISASPSIQITMDGHKQAYALFAVIWNKLAVVYDNTALTVAFYGSKTFPYDSVADMSLGALVLKQAYMPTGTKFKLSATPTGSSYQFVQWQGDISSTKNPTDYIIINNDMSVTAVHKTLSQINVTVEPATYGTATKDPVKAYYEPGDTVTVTATPNPGYKFVGWSGDLTSTANPATFTVPSVNNKTSYAITAEFAIEEPTIKLYPTSLSFKANYDGDDPAAKTVTISNDGGGKLVIDGDALADWLAKQAPLWINKDNVTLNGAAPTGLITIDTNVTLTVSVQTHNPITHNPFDRGTYTVQIPITSPQATNSPQYVTVTFVIE